jgi:hypothetical protein
MGSENTPYVYGTFFSWNTCGPMLDMIILFLEVPNFDLNRYLWRFMVLVRVQMVHMLRVHGQIIHKKKWIHGDSTPKRSKGNPTKHV